MRYSTLSEDQIKKITHRKKLRTGIQKVDTTFGFPTGFYLFCGLPGSGKGWFATWLVRQFWKNNQERSVLFSLEMAEELVRSRVLQQWSDLTQEDYMSGSDVSRSVDLLKTDILIIDDLEDDLRGEQMIDRFKTSINLYYNMGYRIFHFDHLHELSGMNENSTNQSLVEEWGDVFQDICKKYSDIWLFIYLQPNGAASEKSILKRNDIHGSKSITQKCDFFLSLNREKQTGEEVESESRDVILYLDKSRVTTTSRVGFRLYFNNTGNFEDSIINVVKEME